MTQTIRYALPLLEAGQAQKEITHNDAISQIDTLLHLVVESRATPVPAGVTGAAWIVPATATGDLADHIGAVAAFDDAGWSFIAPRDGCIAFVRDEGVFIHFATGAWRDGWPIPSLTISGNALFAGPRASVAAPGGGSVVDVEARAALTQVLTALRGLGLLAA